MCISSNEYSKKNFKLALSKIKVYQDELADAQKERVLNGENMHEKLVKQLRNTGHCCECPYDEDCNEFDSCLMDLLAADAIEDMSKRIARQEKDKYMKTDLQKYKDFFDEMGIDYAIKKGINGIIRLNINTKHIDYGYGNLITIVFDTDEKFDVFEAYGDD